MNGIPFLHTKSSDITFLASDNCISNRAENIIKELHTVTNMYKEIGFNINVYHRYNKFKINSIRDQIRPASLNICAKLQHITIMEISIKTINQVGRCTIHSVTYNMYTRLMTRSLLEYIIHSRNSFPQKGSIRKILGGDIILLGNPNTDSNMNIFWIPCHDIHKYNKCHETQNHH